MHTAPKPNSDPGRRTEETREAGQRLCRLLRNRLYVSLSAALTMDMKVEEQAKDKEKVTPWIGGGGEWQRKGNGGSGKVNEL